MRTKLVSCEHCGEYFWAARSTARFCGATCRKRASRGSTQGTRAYANRDELEELAAVIAQQRPEIWGELEELRQRSGVRAVRSALKIVSMIVKEE